LAGKLQSGEPRAKSYAPAKTLGEAVAPTYVHPPQWSFGGGLLIASSCRNSMKARCQVAKCLVGKPKTPKNTAMFDVFQGKSRSTTLLVSDGNHSVGGLVTGAAMREFLVQNGYRI